MVRPKKLSRRNEGRVLLQFYDDLVGIIIPWFSGFTGALLLLSLLASSSARWLSHESSWFCRQPEARVFSKTPLTYMSTDAVCLLELIISYKCHFSCGLDFPTLGSWVLRASDPREPGRSCIVFYHQALEVVSQAHQSLEMRKSQASCLRQQIVKPQSNGVGNFDSVLKNTVCHG